MVLGGELAALTVGSAYAKLLLWRSTAMKNKTKEIQAHLDTIRRLMSQRPSPYAGMTKHEAIEAMRKTREQLWEEKLAART